VARSDRGNTEAGAVDATHGIIAALAAALPGTGILLIDRDLTVVAAMDCPLTGAGSNGSVVGEALADVLPLKGRQGLLRRFDAAVNGSACEFDHAPTGRERTLRVRAVPRLNAGEPAGALVTSQDITAEREAARRLADERRLFTGTFAAASIGVAMTSLDGIVLRANGRLAALTGYHESELVGIGLGDLVAPDSQPLCDESMRRLSIGELDEYAHDGEYLRHDGSVFPGALRLACVFDDAKRALFFAAHLTDLTQRRQTEEALARATRRFSSAFESAPLGMALVRPDGTVFQANQALTRMTGYEVGELLRMPLRDLVHPDDAGMVDERMSALHDRLEDLQGEMRWFDKQGRILWVSVWASPVPDADDGVDHIVVQVMDVSGQRRMQDRLTHLAEHDALTGLLNRRRFEEELTKEAARAERYGDAGAVLLLDLDDFKSVNDTLGHAAGDQLLKAVARALRRRLRETDLVARLGGDEFAILLPHVTVDQARLIAEELAKAIAAETIGRAGAALGCSASIGVAAVDRQTPSAETTLKNADMSMYDAKRRNAPGARPADAASPASAVDWAETMLPAIAAERFALEAQPIVDAETGRIAQHELLVRLVAGDGTLIPPGVFLPRAERFALMPKIDRWVTAAAVDLLAARPALAALSVNLSARSLCDPGLAAFVGDRLSDSGVDANRLVFEITESEALANLELATRLAGRLAQMGCAISIDDFGSGFAGFGYIKHLPFDYIKIDGGFVRDLAGNSIDRLVVEAVVHVAHGMGKEAIAEWVADADALARVVSLGVTLVQGFHVGRPVPVTSIVSG
jgi:diguanylate cyclase (GGDEF)-like protein/PAS domain S-box-containing protein